MESSEESSSDSPSSDSETKREPDEKEEEEPFVFPPPHFSLKNKSGSDFSPPSESSEEEEEEEEQSTSSSEDSAARPHRPRPPPLSLSSFRVGGQDSGSHRAVLQEDSDGESGTGSNMEPGHPGNSHCSPAPPYQLAYTRRRPATSVDYRQFYRTGGSGSEGGEEEDFEMDYKRRKVCHSDCHIHVHVAYKTPVGVLMIPVHCDFHAYSSCMS